jgi:catechol 2,3-dioxygenase-like lactoylglutathione lyase family enzyme
MSTEAPTPTLGIGIVMLGVRELPRSVAFYRDTLGLPLSFASEEFAFLRAGAITLGLRQASDLAEAREDGRTELVFAVEDVELAYAQLGARGVGFRIAPRVVTGDQLAADFRDPDGHVLSIFGPRKTSGGGGKGKGR